MKIARSLAGPRPGLASTGFASGIYPYLGGAANIDHLRAVMSACGGAVVAGMGGVRLAMKEPGPVVDPARYAAPVKEETESLIDLDEWLERQRAARVPAVLTDTPRIPNRDRTALRKALARWETIDEPTWVVLPIQPWWLKDGLSYLIDEVKAAGRPVALVLLHSYNGLDAAKAVAGLLSFVSEVSEIPVTLLRCDISAIGAVAHGAFAGFVGLSTTTRHGPMPIRRRERTDGDQDGRDESPAVFVPALHDYFKSSKLPAFTRGGRDDVARCDDAECGGKSLLRITRLSEVDPRSSREPAHRHNIASAEQLAQRVLLASEPRDAWWDCCKNGAETSASLIENGVTVPISRWLRQWLDTGSPAHDPQAVA